MAILIDINGTIIHEGKAIDKMVEYVKNVQEDIYLISGSHKCKKDQYEAIMKNLGISYKEMILNPIDENTDITFKGRVARTIPGLSLAIDNNKKILAMYQSMGIKAIHPNDIKPG